MAAEQKATIDATTLAEWGRRAAAGDEEALARLLWSHHARLVGFARRKVGVDWQGKIDPEDLVQEAYIDIASAIRGYVHAGDDAFYAWATRIIDHRFIDHVRHWRRKKRDAAREVSGRGTRSPGRESLLERCLRDEQRPSQDLRREDAAAALAACIARLPDDYRVVVQRYYLAQEPLSAIAADLGRSEDALRRLAGRAVERLCACLGRASRFFSSHG